MKRLGDVMESNGMVLVMSIWDDHAVNMVWLDATDPPGGTALGDAIDGLKELDKLGL